LVRRHALVIHDDSFRIGTEWLIQNIEARAEPKPEKKRRMQGAVETTKQPDSDAGTKRASAAHSSSATETVPRSKPKKRQSRSKALKRTKGPELRDNSAPDLFPLYGVTLGKTTVKELAKLGKHGSLIDDDTGQPYKYYVIGGMDFWYEAGIAHRTCIYEHELMPEEWEALGFSWTNSYNTWWATLRKLGFSVRETKKPTVGRFQRHNCLEAELKAKKRTGVPLEIELRFGKSRGTSVDSPSTLYSLWVSVPY
jgi:hypothetical protein